MTRPERGLYRAITIVLLDGPDFQKLPPEARWVFTALKISLGPCGIQVEYPIGLVEKLAGRTGYPPNVVAEMLDLLQSTGWIRTDRNVVWVVKQLKFEPAMTHKNEKHRAAVVSHIKGLPTLAIVGDFIREYRDYVEDWEEVAKTYPKPDDAQPIAYTIAYRITEKEKDKETETEEVTTTSADAVPEARPHSRASCLGLVVSQLYFGNRPSDQAMRNEASIAGALGEHYGYDRLAIAIQGLALRRAWGEFPNIGPHTPMSLKWLNSAKFDNNQFAISEDAYYRSDASPRTGRGGTAGLGEVTRAVVGRIGA